MTRILRSPSDSSRRVVTRSQVRQTWRSDAPNKVESHDRTMVEIIELPRDAPTPPAPTAQPKPMPKTLYVAVPCYGCLMNNHFVQSLLGLQVVCMRESIDCFVDFIGNESLVQRARNILTARFLAQTRFERLLFIDADIGFDPESVLRLLRFGEDIVTAIYPKKSVNWESVRAKALDPADEEPSYQAGLDFNINIVPNDSGVRDGFVEVLDAATGFMLISRACLERMVTAYDKELRCVNDLQGAPGDPRHVSEYVALFDCMIDPVTRRYLSEDYAFCRRWQQLGGKIFADITTGLCHVGNYVYEGDVRQRLRVAYCE